MNGFFYFKKKNSFSFSRYLDFCVLGEFTIFKICDVMVDIAAYILVKSYSSGCFIRIIRSISVKFAQILVELIADIFNLFLVLL